MTVGPGASHAVSWPLVVPGARGKHTDRCSMVRGRTDWTAETTVRCAHLRVRCLVAIGDSPSALDSTSGFAFVIPCFPVGIRAPSIDSGQSGRPGVWYFITREAWTGCKSCGIGAAGGGIQRRCQKRGEVPRAARLDRGHHSTVISREGAAVNDGCHGQPVRSQEHGRLRNCNGPPSALPPRRVSRDTTGMPSADDRVGGI